MELYLLLQSFYPIYQSAHISLYMAARHLYAVVEKCKMCQKVTVFNFSVCGLKANTWQTLGETIKATKLSKTIEKL